ncbi:MAG: hypothetical protein ACE5GV_09525 [Candidatus Scalindua sp.]
MRYPKYLLIIFIIILSVNRTGFALGKIVDYFLSNQNAWNNTKRITDSTPAKVVVKDGLGGLRLELADLTYGDEVALVFLETKKVEKMNREGFCNLKGKLIRGKNRIVSVITRNHGNRKKFHYEFFLQRRINNSPVKIYNNGDAVLECKYDGTLPVENDSDLSGINLLEIEVR